MIIYIDKDFMCYTEAADGLRAVEVPFFDGKCKAFIEGYRYVPAGEVWTKEDGIEFTGEMITPHTNYAELEKAQLIYEKEQAEEALNILIGGE